MRAGKPARVQYLQAVPTLAIAADAADITLTVNTCPNTLEHANTTLSIVSASIPDTAKDSLRVILSDHMRIPQRLLDGDLLEANEYFVSLLHCDNRWH